MKSFDELSLKDFESTQNLTIQERADSFYEYYKYNSRKQYLNYRIVSKNGNDSLMRLINPYNQSENDYISFVSNDYLGFTKHPEVIEAGVLAIIEYGSGSGSSPLIGGQSVIHEKLAHKVAEFHHKKHALTYTSGYAANNGTFQALLNMNDIAILDVGVHASIIEGCSQTNKKFFLHNNMESLERVLKQVDGKYVNKAIIVDDVFSQDGDIAPIRKIVYLAKKYHAFFIVDEAHGVGVIGKTGRGAIEMYNAYNDVDMITGTFSKAFASVGGYVIANKQIITLLKFTSASNIFSTGATPQSAASAIKAMEIIDKEPIWLNKLQKNIEYFRAGLNNLGIDYGNTTSAIFPIMIRDEMKTKIAGKLLFENGVYANPILYPAVSRKHTRIRMSLMATHTQKQLDKTLNVLEYVLSKIDIIKKPIYSVAERF